MSLVLVNRLVLNLRRAGSEDDTVNSLHSLPAFAQPTDSLLGNIGAPLRDGTESHVEDEDDQIPSSTEVLSKRQVVRCTN